MDQLCPQTAMFLCPFQDWPHGPLTTRQQEWGNHTDPWQQNSVCVCVCVGGWVGGGVEHMDLWQQDSWVAGGGGGGEPHGPLTRQWGGGGGGDQDVTATEALYGYICCNTKNNNNKNTKKTTTTMWLYSGTVCKESEDKKQPNLHSLHLHYS